MDSKWLGQCTKGRCLDGEIIPSTVAPCRYTMHYSLRTSSHHCHHALSSSTFWLLVIPIDCTQRPPDQHTSNDNILSLRRNLQLEEGIRINHNIKVVVSLFRNYATVTVNIVLYWMIQPRLYSLLVHLIPHSNLLFKRLDFILVCCN